MPLKKDFPASPFIHQLLCHATFAMDEENERNIRAVLASKGVKDFDDHYFFNRRYWLRQVRFFPRKADDASDNLLAVLSYLKKSDAFAEYVSDEFIKYIVGWAKRCQEGRYEDLPDVHMFDSVGFDSDGLELYQSRRGSKAENFHQKMHVVAEPYGIGVEKAHYLHLILSY